MDRGIWATWYDLPAEGRDEYLSWLHEVHLPAMLSLPGYLWAAHVENVVTPEREQQINGRLTHTADPAVPAGFSHLLLYGATSAHVFFNPSPQELAREYSPRTAAMLASQKRARASIFVEVDRVEGPNATMRRPGVTPGPVIQFGSFNSNSPKNEDEISTWYARSRLPLIQPLAGTVGARKLVAVSGWAKHAILYEFATMEAATANLVDPSEWSRRVVDNLVHAPHSPTLGRRIWPAV